MAITISSGIVSSGLTTGANGNITVLSGGKVSATGIAGTSKLTVSFGGSAVNTSANGGSMYVMAGGSASGISGNGAQVVINGYVRVLNSNTGMKVSVCNGGILSSGIMGKDGKMFISSGGIAYRITMSDGAVAYISSGGYVNTATVSKNGSVTIDSDAKLIAATVASGGSMTIKDRGYAYNITMSAGGELIVDRGATAAGIKWTPGAGTIKVGYGATISYLSSASLQGVQYCNSAGSVTSQTSVNGVSVRNGSMYVMSGGSASSVSLERNGVLEVWSGGSATNVYWTPGMGSLRIYDGAYVTFASQYYGVYWGKSGSEVYHAESSGSLDSGVTYVMQNGVIANGSTYGGEVHVWSGGIMRSMVVKSNTDVILSNGAVALRNTVESGEILVFSGAVANNTSVTSYGTLVVFSGGNINNTVLSNCVKSCVVSSGGVANRVTVNGGELYVYSTGVVHSALLSGGSAFVSGGIANSTTVSAGGNLLVYNEGVANDTIASGGAVHLFDGALANRTVINEYSELNVFEGGFADLNTVNHGDLNVFSSGSAFRNTVNSEGALYVWQAGYVLDTVVNGGELTLWEGGHAQNTVLGKESDLYLWSGTLHTGTLTIDSTAEVYAAAGSRIDFTLENRSVKDDFLVSDLSLIEGAPTYTVTLDPHLAAGTYKLGGNAFGFEEDVLIYSGDVWETTISVGFTAEIGRGVYTLTCNDGNLCLDVDYSTPVHNDINGDNVADLIMNNGTNAGAWLISETGQASWKTLSVLPASWTLIGTGNADGNRYADVYLYNESSNTVGIWCMDAKQSPSWASFAPFGNGISVVGLGDFNGDGLTDVLLRRDSDGAVGTSLSAGTGWSEFTASDGMSTQVCAVGDFDGNGYDDILFREADFVSVWLVDDVGPSMYIMGFLPTETEIAGAGDFNGDGIEDILLRDRGINSCCVWLMNGNGTVSETKDLGAFSTGFVIDGIADLNGDGRADIQVRNGNDLGVFYTTDSYSQYRVLGSVPAEYKTSVTIPSDTWQTAPATPGSALKNDLNGDGIADIVMVNENGQAGAWLLDGRGGSTWNTLSELPGAWEAAAAQDVNGDRFADVILWNAETKAAGAWIMDGDQLQWQGYGILSDGDLAGVDDFNGDGKADLLYRKSDGSVGVQFLNSADKGFETALDNAWQIAGTGDINGDGTADLILRNGTAVGAWLMSGEGPVWQGLSELGTESQIVGLGDLNGDGTDDIVINTNGSYGAWSIAEGQAVAWQAICNFPASVVIDSIADLNGDGIDDLQVRNGNDLAAVCIGVDGTPEWKTLGSVSSAWRTELAG